MAQLESTSILTPQQVFIVYIDPVTRQNPEGPARLLKSEDDTDPELGHRWMVQFIDDQGQDDYSGPVSRDGKTHQ